MAYNENLAERIEKILKAKKVKFIGKKMMGGLCFIVNDKMCMGVEKERLMARIGPDNYEAALKKKGAQPMDFTGKPMVGFVFVDLKNLDKDSELKYWIDLCLEYNPKAKVSAKKKKMQKGKKESTQTPSTSDVDVLEKLGKIISKNDKNVKMGEGKIMGTKGFVFNQLGVFKYGVAKTKSGYTFHSMAIYANPELYADLKSKLKKAKFQKGCVNFKSLEDFPLSVFDKHMIKAAKFDYSKVIEHYNKVKKKK
ncbi:MAG: TfoX/Sxy family protein [Bacteroidetes bacterium]|nr:TfoX/Sxy family protein [Bacteroidota bacterium]